MCPYLISNCAVSLRARASAPQNARGSSAPCARSRLILFFQLRCAAARRARRKVSKAFCLILFLVLRFLKDFNFYINVSIFDLFIYVCYIFDKF